MQLKCQQTLVKPLEFKQSAVQAAHFLSTCIQEEFTDFLISFKEMIESSFPQSTQKFPLIFNSETHTICIAYDPVKKSWLFCDANCLPVEFIEQEDDLVKNIYNSFFCKDDLITFSTQIYTHFEYGSSLKNSMSFLLKNGANADVVNQNGQTALDLAKAMGNLEIVNLFMQHRFKKEEKIQYRSCSSSFYHTSLVEPAKIEPTQKLSLS